MDNYIVHQIPKAVNLQASTPHRRGGGALGRLLDRALEAEALHRDALLRARQIRSALEKLIPLHPIDGTIEMLWILDLAGGSLEEVDW